MFNNMTDEELINKYNQFKRLVQDPELHGQKFLGGWTYASTKYWQWVMSLDFGSLYPNLIVFFNIGADTLIEPKDLPDELVELRTKYFMYLENDWETKDVNNLVDYFIQNTLENPEAAKIVSETLNRYNVTCTPNGMFFTKERQSVLSQLMENIMVNRKIHKKKMKGHLMELERLKGLEGGYDQVEFDRVQALADMENVYQMGNKIAINSAYGSLSLPMNPFAGQAEFFSSAITSGGQVANMLNAQRQNAKIHSLIGKEVTNRLAYITQCDTDSSYFTYEPIIIKKFGEDYAETMDSTKLVNIGLKYIDISQKVVKEGMEHLEFVLNSYKPSLVMDAEVITDKFISIAPKMYFARKYWDEGVTLAKPKLKVTGLSMIRATTPKFFRESLNNAMGILIEGDIQRTVEFMDETRKEMVNQSPKDLATNVGVTSLDYEYDDIKQKYLKWNGIKYLSAPMNSRASIKHNEYIAKMGLDIKDIEGGDKISHISLKTPNPAGTDVIAFINPKIWELTNLAEYIDYETVFEKGFEGNIKLITEPLKWELIDQSEVIDIDDW